MSVSADGSIFNFFYVSVKFSDGFFHKLTSLLVVRQQKAVLKLTCVSFQTIPGCTTRPGRLFPGSFLLLWFFTLFFLSVHVWQNGCEQEPTRLGRSSEKPIWTKSQKNPDKPGRSIR